MKNVNIYNSNCCVFKSACGQRVAVWASGERSLLGPGDYNNEEVRELAPVSPMPEFRLAVGHGDNIGASMAYGPCLHRAVEEWAQGQAPEGMVFEGRCN